MGTRADFYLGRGTQAQWLGSIGWDGFPSSLPDDLLQIKDATTWTAAVEKFLRGREDGTLPQQGWPWPWEDSNLTDYSYALDDGKVWATHFGHGWWDPLTSVDDPDDIGTAPTIFPDMSEIQKVALDKRSGLIIL